MTINKKYMYEKKLAHKNFNSKVPTGNKTESEFFHVAT